MREFIVYERQDGVWVAECNEIAGYRAEANTREEAIDKLKKALLIYYPCRCED